jgi:hypothetical protein
VAGWRDEPESRLRAVIWVLLPLAVTVGWLAVAKIGSTSDGTITECTTDSWG